MKPEILALMTAICWGVGGFFEKKGLHEANMAPVMGITIRTGVALLILAAASYPHWKSLSTAGGRALTYMVVGGGVTAGAAGMLLFYMAIKGAPLGRVMPIAFTSPLFGALMGIMFGGEPLTTRVVIGTILTVGGIFTLAYR